MICHGQSNRGPLYKIKNVALCHRPTVSGPVEKECHRIRKLKTLPNLSFREGEG